MLCLGFGVLRNELAPRGRTIDSYLSLSVVRFSEVEGSGCGLQSRPQGRLHVRLPMVFFGQVM